MAYSDVSDILMVRLVYVFQRSTWLTAVIQSPYFLDSANRENVVSCIVYYKSRPADHRRIFGSDPILLVAK